MKHSTNRLPTVRRLAIAVRGVVQGVGFRPFVYNAARARRLGGWVKNEADTVRIEVQGNTADLDAFIDTLRKGHPPQAKIDSLEISETACDDGQAATFRICAGSGSAAPGPTIPADMATCAECLDEIRAAGQRRYGYPFTNCTNCGPRWSIIRQLPYDRPRTSMAGFQMCPDCRREYADPADRRFHAQPIACPRCGPTLKLLDSTGRETAGGQEALDMAVEALLAGRIVAMKGLGGFQLLVDATNVEAVARLRQRKRRPDRPLALMFPSLEEVRRHCEVCEEEARTLMSPEAPMLLLRRDICQRVASPAATLSTWPERGASPAATRSSDDVVDGVAPGNPYLGVMLPYTPLHHLLTAAVGRPVVCTSGNLSEEPMAITTDDALERLGPIADVVLTHNRPIVRPVDDSVARLGPDGLQVLRRARGYAPLPIELVADGVASHNGTVLAVGGHLKNTVALGLGPQVVLSPHVGDLDSLLGVEVHRRAVRDMVDFFEVVPDVVACDLHPDYASSRHAESLAAEWDVPLVRVQHHHAHVAACMAEHQLEGPVLGLAWDGTGYGPDGTVWGGEALICEGANFTRAAHLRTFALPGGDKAVRQPRRSALGLLFEVFGEQAAKHVMAAGIVGGDSVGDVISHTVADGVASYNADWFDQSELRTLLSMLARRVHAPRTNSMGRLFDAVAALCGLPGVISFEGQAAMALEFAADWSEQEAYPLPLSDETPAVADWEPTIHAILADRAAGVPVGRISGRFHNALAELAVAVARRCGCKRVALTGGCFQNALLTERVRVRLSESGFAVYTHKRVPPNDGGIALGQVLVAARQGLRT